MCRTGGLFLTALLALSGCKVTLMRTDNPPPPDLYSWSAPRPVEQLERDTTAVPPGLGAVFVPAISRSDDEPDVVVLGLDREQVANGGTGERIMVPPGTYIVAVGSGSLSQAVTLTVTVHERGTAIVPVEWGGLIVEVVDENNVPFRGEYELISLQDREVMGIGLGADTLLGERLRTWLLAPGLYQIVLPGQTYRARTDFATVHVPNGALVRFKLVLDTLSGQFRGAGVVYPDELSTTTGTVAWNGRLTLGVNLGLAQSVDVVGVSNQLVLSADLFFDAFLAFERGPTSLIGIFELEEGVVLVDPAEGDALPVQQSRDRFRADLVYTYYLNEWVGPYLAFGVVATLFPARVIATEDIVVRRIFTDGTVEDEAVAASSAFSSRGAFGSVELSQGTGLNLRLLRSTLIDTNLRVGVGLRQNLFHDAFVADDQAETAEIEYRELTHFNQEGLEAVLTATVRFLRYLTYTTEAEAFAPFEDLLEPTLRWDNTLSFRFASFAALDYKLDLVNQPRVSDALQVTQNVLLRLAWNIL